jgi:hypothetical protein
MTLPTAALALAYSPGSWSTSFTLTGTAAATLTGLFFVALSLRVRDLRQSVMFKPRARYLLLWLIVVTVGSAFVVCRASRLPCWGGEPSSGWWAARFIRSGRCFGRLGGSCLRSQPIWPGGGLAWW